MNDVFKRMMIETVPRSIDLMDNMLQRQADEIKRLKGALREIREFSRRENIERTVYLHRILDSVHAKCDEALNQ